MQSRTDTSAAEFKAASSRKEILRGLLSETLGYLAVAAIFWLPLAAILWLVYYLNPSEYSKILCR